MEDWRLRGQEEYLTGAVLRRVVFPDFWKSAYAQKNSFYQRIHDHAVSFVKTMHRGEEYLEGEKVGRFWHAHCVFCWEKAATDTECEFYCTDDFRHWICKTCFEDFREELCWLVQPERYP